MLLHYNRKADSGYVGAPLNEFPRISQGLKVCVFGFSPLFHSRDLGICEWGVLSSIIGNCAEPAIEMLADLKPSQGNVGTASTTGLCLHKRFCHCSGPTDNVSWGNNGLEPEGSTWSISIKMSFILWNFCSVSNRVPMWSIALSQLEGVEADGVEKEPLIATASVIKRKNVNVNYCKSKKRLQSKS